jgi:hypothetical protein
MLIQYLYQDEPQLERFQSGLLTVTGRPKPSLYAFPFPLAQAGRVDRVARIWGQIRPRAGRQTYRLQLLEDGHRTWLTPVRRTDRRGTFEIRVAIPSGSLIRVWSRRDRRYSPPLVVG